MGWYLDCLQATRCQCARVAHFSPFTLHSTWQPCSWCVNQIKSPVTGGIIDPSDVAEWLHSKEKGSVYPQIYGFPSCRSFEVLTLETSQQVTSDALTIWFSDVEWIT